MTVRRLRRRTKSAQSILVSPAADSPFPRLRPSPVLQVGGDDRGPRTRIIAVLFDSRRQEVHCFREPPMVQDLLGACQSIFALGEELRRRTGNTLPGGRG